MLVDHPLDPGLIRQVQTEWLAFFTSGAARRYLAGPGHQDGYHPLSTAETAVGAAVPDVKEYFHWFAWGRHPSEVSDAAAVLHRRATDLAATLLGWLDGQIPASVRRGLSMPLASMLDGATGHLLRILRYPPLTGAEAAGSERAAAHGDINLLTVLPAATRPGLQVCDSSGAWHDVSCDPGSVVVNGGDMLDLATGGWFPSTTHRVVLPDGDEGRRSRMSTPLFLHPAEHVVLAEGVTAFGYLRERLLDISGVDIAAAPGL